MGADAVAGLILTGGASRRLGTDKAALAAGGQTLAARVAGILAGAVDGPVIEVGPGWTGHVTVREDPPGQGPLAAVAAGAAALEALGHAGPALVLACDLPNVTVALLRWLAGQRSTAVPVVDGRDQTLCARYDRVALAAAHALTRSGHRSMRDLLAAVDAVRLGPERWGPVADAAAFADIDTAADLARWRSTFGTDPPA